MASPRRQVAGSAAHRHACVDLCTGTADVALAAAPRAGRVIGVDFSHEMLRLGLEKVRARALGDRIALARGDAMRSAAGRRVGRCGRDQLRHPQRPGARGRLAGTGPSAAARAAGWRSSSSACRPRAPFRALYLWYANRLLPAVGRLISRHASAYDYLPESVSRFPPPEAFGRLLQANGFPHVEIVPLTLGIVYLYIARK